jgi:hypothetical protein
MERITTWTQLQISVLLPVRHTAMFKSQEVNSSDGARAAAAASQGTAGAGGSTPRTNKNNLGSHAAAGLPCAAALHALFASQ